jgi:hypothetical protein
VLLDMAGGGRHGVGFFAYDSNAYVLVPATPQPARPSGSTSQSNEQRFLRPSTAGARP